MQRREYFVYILASASGVLYVGATSDLLRRMAQHRTGALGGFTKRYAVTRLVYFESTTNPYAAVTRERQIKTWTREKKLTLIESVNAGGQDLTAAWFQ